jgi:hypothetical protein
MGGLAVVSDQEIWHTAIAMIRRYGPNAALEAGERSDLLTASGEIGESEIWQRILVAIKKLQAEKPGPGEMIQ